MPMIPLGLKETKEVDFREPFKDFILEHYSEDANLYDDVISDFMDSRQVWAWLSFKKLRYVLKSVGEQSISASHFYLGKTTAYI